MLLNVVRYIEMKAKCVKYSRLKNTSYLNMCHRLDNVNKKNIPDKLQALKLQSTVSRVVLFTICLIVNQSIIQRFAQ